MLKSHRVLSILTCCLVIVFSTTLMARSRTAGIPHRYQPASEDRQLVQVTNPVDGQTWSAWAFRSGAQYDIALSSLDEQGRWNEPVFQGRDDGVDQVDPTFAIHESGVLVVAFAEPARGRILISALPPGGQAWSRPVPVASGDDLRSPSLLIVGNRLVVAYRAGGRVHVVDIPLAGESPASTHGFTDGPDTTGSGTEDDRNDSDEENDDESGGVNKTGMVPVIDDDAEH